MDFEVSEKMQPIIEMMDEFVEKELIPLEPEFLKRSFADMTPELEEKRRIVRQMELWAPQHPPEYGGMGLDLMEFALVSEALGRSPLGHYVFGAQAPDAGNIEILHLYGTDEQKKTYLRPLVAGEIRSCFSMTEVDMPGSNPVMLETTAVREGNEYVINGQKWYTTSADGANFAIVMAVTNPEAPRYLQASMLIVPADTPGFNLVRNIWPVTRKYSTSPAEYRRRISSDLKVTVLSLRRNGWGRAEFITACDGSGSATGPLP